MDPNPPRTCLEQLIQSSRRILTEHCDDFEATAKKHNEPAAALGYRQLSRWKRGDVRDARLFAQRVAEFHWGEPFEVLVGPPRAEPDGSGRHVAGDATAQQAMSILEVQAACCERVATLVMEGGRVQLVIAAAALSRSPE